jgi:hypothetical protein
MTAISVTTPAGIDLQTTEYGDVDMAAADQTERHRTVESGGAGQRADRLATGIGQQRVGHPLLGYGTRANQSVLGLKENVQSWRHIVCDQRRNADA